MMQTVKAATPQPAVFHIHIIFPSISPSKAAYQEIIIKESRRKKVYFMHIFSYTSTHRPVK
jgi:hypothetical protein